MQKTEGKKYYPVRSFENLREMLEQSVSLYKDQPAFRFRQSPAADDIQTRSYQNFLSDCRAVGTSLLRLNLKGSRIAVVGANSYAWCVAHAAVINGAGVVVPIDSMLPQDELIDLLSRGKVEAVFYDAGYQLIANAAAEKLSQLRFCICLRPALVKKDELPSWQNDMLDDAGRSELDADVKSTKPSTAAFLSFDTCLESGYQAVGRGDASYSDITIDADALASLLFTSGTTSEAKAVMLSHRNICANIRGLAGVVSLPPGIRMLSVLPLHHTFENTCGLYMALYVGAQIHESDGLRYIQKNMNEYKIEMVIGVPLLFSNFYSKVQSALKKSGKDKLVNRLIPVTQVLRKAGIDLRRIIYKQILDAFGGHFRLGICGAAPVDPDMLRFFDAVGIRILEGYGLTEASPVISGCNTKVFAPGTVGEPLYGVTVAVLADKPGEPGEILAKGESIMLGYYENPEATAEAIDSDGWLHTGDMGLIDPKSGLLKITGRLKSMIVLKTGKKVFPEEIEHLIGQHDYIKESLVWGEDDESGDVVISAKFVIDKEALEQSDPLALDEKTLQERLNTMISEINSKMPSFKSIRQYVYSFQEMVKTTTRKVKRPVEIEKMKRMMEDKRLQWRQLTGRNIDQLEEDVQPEKDQRPESDQDH